MTSSADVARVLLAGIRLTMGSAGLLAPGLVIRRLDIDPATQPGMRCPLRVFGIRTVLIGAELLTPDTRRRGHAEQLAPSSTAATRSRRSPPGAGAMATGISAVDLVLSLVNLGARRRHRPRRLLRFR